MKGIIEVVSCLGQYYESVGRMKYHYYRHAEEDYRIACKNALRTGSDGNECAVILYRNYKSPENLTEYQMIDSKYANFIIDNILK
jgi:hypothetical protein